MFVIFLWNDDDFCLTSYFLNLKHIFLVHFVQELFYMLGNNYNGCTNLPFRIYLKINHKKLFNYYNVILLL